MLELALLQCLKSTPKPRFLLERVLPNPILYPP